MPSINNDLAPLTGALSIVQLRITLVGLLMVISAAVWWPNAGGSTHHAVQKFSKTPVPDVVAEMDFTDAQASWGGLRIDPQGNLMIDAQTESALSESIALMHEQAAELQMARIALLLERQFGATTSQQFMELLPVLKNYQEIEQIWWEEHGSRHPPPYAELFELQDELLGEVLAEKMFSEQRRIVEIMLASHAIRNDTSLTQAERDQALIDLQNTFQDEGGPIE